MSVLRDRRCAALFPFSPITVDAVKKYIPLWVVGMVYIFLVQRLTAFTCLAPTLKPCLGPDEVQFVIAASTVSQHHIVPSAVKVGALLKVWPIMAG